MPIPNLADRLADRGLHPSRGGDPREGIVATLESPRVVEAELLTASRSGGGLSLALQLLQLAGIAAVLVLLLAGCAGRPYVTDAALRDAARVETLRRDLAEVRVRYAQTAAGLEGLWVVYESAAGRLEPHELERRVARALDAIPVHRAKLKRYERQLDELEADLKHAAEAGAAWFDRDRRRYVLSLVSRVRQAEGYEAELAAYLTPERRAFRRELLAAEAGLE